MRPRIVVTTSRNEPATEYLAALDEAGASTVLVDPSHDPMVALADADGVLITGGVDVDPARYGAPHSGLIGETQPERDELEETLLYQARERGLPTLCICRGIQIANVAFGGTLLADIPDALGPRGLRHSVRNAEGKVERGLVDGHVVNIEPRSLLARIVGKTQLQTGARHHQAIERVAEDLRVTGRTGDGIIEALEARFASPFWLAVQWHPESTRELDDGASRAIFRSFVGAATP